MKYGSKVTPSVLAMLVATGWAGPAMAQDAAGAATDGTSETVELPGLIVETSPAKRNVKKAQLRRNVQPSGAPAASGPIDAAALPQQVVEGEKILRTLRDTTTSIGIITGQDIKEQQIQDLQEALNQTANVTAPEGSRGNSGFTIRGLNSEGLTQNQNPSAAPLISVVIDGATQNPEATRRGARGLWDVEQVEVLRGPQSALQARNALAGAVVVKTNDPTYKWETIIEGTAGQFDLKSGGFVVNAPIVTNQAALRISGQAFERHHGINYGDPANDELDHDVLRTIRGKLLLEPDSIPGLSALFTIAHVDDTPAVTSVSTPFFDRVLNLGFGDSVDFRATKTSNYVADVGYDIAPGLTVRSITSYADTETDIGTAEGSLYERDVARTGGDFTQDVRLEIDNAGNGLSGVVGLFYGSFKSENDTFDSVTGLPVQDLFSTTETESIAAYADLRYRFMDRFVFFGGGRLLRDSVSSTSDGFVIGNIMDVILNGAWPPIPLPIQGNFSNEFTEALPRVGLTYDLTREQTVGISYNKGYRNGFTEFRYPTMQFNEVRPEYLDAYEISYRSDWLNKTLSFNANAFYYDYENQQVAFDEIPGMGGIDFPMSYILNAESSHAYGAEFEARWRPIVPLQLFASLGLMKTEFDDFTTATNDYSGNEFPDAPAYTLAAGGMYRDRSGWFAGANMRYTDGYYSGGNLLNSPLRLVDGYTTVDVRTGWETEKLTFTVFAKNVFNEDYVTSLDRDGTEATVGDERLVGVTLTGKF